MGYSAQQDLERIVRLDVLVELTDDSETGEVDPAVVTEAIAKADALINSYVRKRYTTPLSPVPEQVRSLSADIALYYIFRRRGISESSADKAVVDGYRDALRFLKDLGEGKSTLDVAAPPNAPEGGVAISTRTQMFGEKDLSGF